MPLTAADLAALRAIVREELARAADSGRAYSAGIGTRVEGDPCNTNERKEFMDPTNIVDDGELSELRRMAHDDSEALRRATRRSRTSRSSSKKRTAGR